MKKLTAILSILALTIIASPAVTHAQYTYTNIDTVGAEEMHHKFTDNFLGKKTDAQVQSFQNNKNADMALDVQGHLGFLGLTGKAIINGFFNFKTDIHSALFADSELVKLEYKNQANIKKLEVDSNGVSINDAYYFPNTQGTLGQVLTADGAGNTSWTTVSGGTGGGVAYELYDENPTPSGMPNTVTGNDAVAIGVFHTASGNYSTISGGNLNNAIADGATISGGILNTASGKNSTVSGGNKNFARSFGEWSGGVYGTDYTPLGGSGWIQGGDRIFNIGNGISGNNRSDVFTILKNGQTGIDFDNFQAVTDGNKLQVNGGITATLPIRPEGDPNNTLSTGMFYQTDGTGTLPVGVVMIK